MQVKPATQALLEHGRRNTWDSAVAERFAGECWPRIEPSFQLAPGATVFTIGSCFARNIERHIQRLGYRVPTLEYADAEAKHYPARSNFELTKYTPADIVQEVAWAERIFSRDGMVRPDDIEPFAEPDASGGLRDLALASLTGVARPVSRERFESRRHRMYEVWQQAFGAECVVITLGLVEAWWDRQNGIWIVNPPTFARRRDGLDRFELRILDFEICLEMMRMTLALIRHHNAGARFLVTTSPVPLHQSYSEDDVLVANCAGKSLLRAVCATLAEDADVDYFPSYESVTLTMDPSVWSADRRHVSDAFVGKIVGQLVKAYFRSAPTARIACQKAATALADRKAERALELALSAVGLDPELGEAWLVGARAAQALDRRREALDMAERCLRLDGACSPALRIWLEVALGLGIEENLAARAEALLRAAPEDPHSHLLLARVRWQAGELEGAELAFAEASHLSPWPFFKLPWSEFLRETGQVEVALRNLRTWIASSPENLELRLERIRCLAALGRRDEAEAQLEIAAALPGADGNCQLAALRDEVTGSRPEGEP